MLDTHEPVSPVHSRLARATLLAVVLFPTLAGADWINLSGAENSRNIAEIYVQDNHVKIVLELFPDDLIAFHQIMPDEFFGEDGAAERAPEAERLAEFANEGLQVLTAEGKKLPVEVLLVEPRMRVDRASIFAGMQNPITGRITPGPPEDKRVVYTELRYPFQKKPKALTFIPPLDSNGQNKAGIGFIVEHKSVPVIDFRFLAGSAKLALDWEDPWYSKFDNPNLKRHHQSALMSFLYVEPYEVRHEVLTRVKDLDEWMDLGLRNDEFIEVDELEPLRNRISEFLMSKNEVKIDGVPGQPILDRATYIKVGVTGIQLLETPERMETNTAIIGVIFAYLTDGIPQEVTVDWELFTDQIQQVPATMTDPAGPMPYFLSPDDKQLRWENFLKKYELPQVRRVELADELRGLQLPLASTASVLLLIPIGFSLRNRRQRGVSIVPPLGIGAVLIVAAILSSGMLRVTVPIAMPMSMASQVSEADGKLILDSLLQNIYRAFDFREEEDVYDKLALSVEGELLADVYIQNRKSFAVKKAGGAQAKVKEVAVEAVTVRPVPGNRRSLELEATWSAKGSVGHWGHIHTRMNKYQALLTLEPVDGAWKLTSLDILQEERVQ